MESSGLSSLTPRGSSSSSHEDDQSTPATSPSSFGSPLLGPSHEPWSADKAAFLSNLDNFLAMGCLCFEDFVVRSEDNKVPTNDWQELRRAPFLLSHDTSFVAQLSRLAANGWIRIQTKRSSLDSRFVIYRIYVLPGDVGLRFVDRGNKRLWAALETLVAEIDISPEIWQGRYAPSTARKSFDMWATGDEGSLFYMFNKLPSPSPDVGSITEKYAREALEDLLDPASVLPGLETVLYPYQRRSAGLMLQRECVASLDLDPRLEQRKAPDGTTFYYNSRELLFLRHPRYYEACRGGILAETMGLGKTVILLAMILATKHHPPRIPEQHNQPVRRPKVSMLSTMAVAASHRKSVPWRVEFQRIQHATGNDMSSCIRHFEKSPPVYRIPLQPQRWNRNTIIPEPKEMTLATTTLIVVPRNLCKQWQSEISKHVEDGMLRVLVMEDPRQALPTPDELRSYDIILFSRNRFELENKDGSDEQGRRLLATQLVCRCSYIGASRRRNCNCVRSDDLYDSPLKYLHFKRLIIDEGHFFSNNSSIAVSVANKLITADHRWVVSGTPAKDLLGVEVDMSAAENLWLTPETRGCRETMLEQRRQFSTKDDARGGAIKSLGALACSFLKIKPWYASDLGDRKADWDDHIYRHEDLRKRTYSGFSSCLWRTLGAMVVKTQPHDVERDIQLPPLNHEIVRLEPSFYDKLTANLFTLVLTANAITSERTDTDYLFHKNSAKARYQLISNLRQSAFFWTGFTEADVEASMKNSNGYLAKEGTACTEEDRQLLKEVLAFADVYLASAGWKSLSRSHELGLYVEQWPVESAEHWSFDVSSQPLLTGATQLLEAQRFVNERTVTAQDPQDGLAGAGIRELANAFQDKTEAMEEASGRKRKAEKSVLTKSGIPSSSLDGEPILKRRRSSTGGVGSPKKAVAFETDQPRKRKSSSKPSPSRVKTESDGPTTPTKHNLPIRKRRRSEVEAVDFAADSPFLDSRIVGTTSAKLSYLVSQILKYYKDEKILVFYDGDNVAYYIAQMLELLHIKHEIYAKSLPAPLKSEYVVRFDQEPQDRVLLMDVKQAAFGLNLSSASRIYFVNPVCRPNIEAQAIKRAHRIGQTRKVFIETLVLKGTIEEKMLERSKRMTRAEHLDAKVLEDDGGIREIIQSARLLPVSEHEKTGYGQMAPLQEPQQLWGRPGWKETISVASPAKDRRKRAVHFADATDPNQEDREVLEEHESNPAAKRRVLSFVDCTIPDADDVHMEEHSDEEACVRSDEPFVKGMKAGRNPFLYSMPPAERLAPVYSPLSTPSPTAESSFNADQFVPRRVSIGDLLNDDGAHEQPNAELMQDILRWL